MSDKRIPAAEIRRVWLDPALTTAEAARAVGLTRANLWRRAMAMGLPSRKRGKRPIADEAEFTLLWNAGVASREIAKYFGIDRTTVSGTKRRLGLKSRPQGFNHRVLTLAQYREQELAVRLLAAADAEERAIRQAGRRDDVRPPKCP